MPEPDTKLAPGKHQRSVISRDPGDFDQWLEGAAEQETVLMRLTPFEVFYAGPA